MGLPCRVAFIICSKIYVEISLKGIEFYENH